MEELWFICRNRWRNECIPEVADCWRPREINGSIQIPKWPIGEKLKKTDELCKYCKHRFFELKVDDLSERECPVCESNDFIGTKGSEIFTDGERKVVHYFLKCRICGTHTVLSKQY